MVSVQTARKDNGFQSEIDRVTLRRTGTPFRNGGYASSAMFHQTAREGGMNWIQRIVALWKGESFLDDKELSDRVINDAKEAIDTARRTLNGEDFWGIRSFDDRK
jgi:hypothetical protein